MRFEDWPSRLQEVIRKWECVPFDRATTDCVEFAIDVIAELTGRQIINPEAGNYVDEATALACVQKHGASLREVVSDYMGEEITTSFAQRGDLVLRQNNLGICLGKDAAFRHETGLVLVPMRKCECAWRVE